MLVTKKEIQMNFRGYDITIPKGIKTTHLTACGVDEKYNFIDDLNWIPKDSFGNKQYFLIHDATYYGINIPIDLLEEF